jgi:hypothetical protein
MQSEVSKVFVLGLESITNLPVEHPWGTNTKLSTTSHIQKLFDDLDVVELIETHLFPDETPLYMLGFQCLHNPHPVFNMSSVRATVKHSGGVVIFVNDSWLDCVSLWKQSTDGTRLWL